MANVLLIGKNSFLGQAFVRASAGHHAVTAVSHGEVLPGLELAGWDAVVNMAYDRRTMHEDYDAECDLAERDMDVRIARELARLGPGRPRFYMMSTRMVYGREAPLPAPETTPAAPPVPYARNKLMAEAEVARLLGADATILRLSNIFGFEPGRHTFCGIALARLKAEGRIVLDVSPFVARDFLPVDDFARALVRVVARAPSGLFNLGSGRATPVGQVALSIIEGYGKGELVIANPREWDSHMLDTRRIRDVIGDYTAEIDLRTACLGIGERLKQDA